jgi:acyl carrier protein
MATGLFYKRVLRREGVPGGLRSGPSNRGITIARGYSKCSVVTGPDRLTEALTQFLAAHRRVDPAKLSPQTRLFEDLGCDGDAAADLLLAYSRAFGVSLDTFDITCCFGPEAAFNPVLFVFRKIVRTHSSRHVSLTIDHLAEGARTGKLPA